MTVVQPCGTWAAAMRHYRRDEPLDEACRAARAEHNARWSDGGAKVEELIRHTMCPHCQMPAGEVCVTPISGRPCSYVHAARIERGEGLGIMLPGATRTLAEARVPLLRVSTYEEQQADRSADLYEAEMDRRWE